MEEHSEKRIREEELWEEINEGVDKAEQLYETYKIYMDANEQLKRISDPSTSEKTIEIIKENYVEAQHKSSLYEKSVSKVLQLLELHEEYFPDSGRGVDNIVAEMKKLEKETEEFDKKATSVLIQILIEYSKLSRENRKT